jgi:hypothetical protein
MARRKSRSPSGKAKRKLPKGWARLFKAHNSRVEGYLLGKNEDDFDYDSVSLADIVAQAYFSSLRRAVPSTGETKRPYVPLYVERLLIAHIGRLNEMLCEMARAGRWTSCEELWDQALKLTTVFSELAQKNPNPFKTKARQSLYMPSLRVPPKPISKSRMRQKWIDPFLGDSVNVAHAIELSANTVGAKITDNRTQIGSLCAQLVGECVQEIQRARYLWSNLFIPYGKPVVWPTLKEIEPYLGMAKVDDVMADVKREPSRQPRGMKEHLRFFCLLEGCGANRLHFLILKDLTKAEALNWWKGAIEKMVEQKFPDLMQHPNWIRELKRVSSGTVADMRKELKDYCRDKVKQFV